MYEPMAPNLRSRPVAQMDGFNLYGILDEDGTVWMRPSGAGDTIGVARHLLNARNPHAFTVCEFDDGRIVRACDLVRFCELNGIEGKAK